MLALGAFTTLSFVSSVILYTLPQANPTIPDLSSTWISWSTLLAICLVMSRRRTNLANQQYELLENGSPQSSSPAVRRVWDGVLLTALPAVLVAAGILANTQASQYWLVCGASILSERCDIDSQTSLVLSLSVRSFSSRERQVGSICFFYIAERLTCYDRQTARCSEPQKQHRAFRCGSEAFQQLEYCPPRLQYCTQFWSRLDTLP